MEIVGSKPTTSGGQSLQQVSFAAGNWLETVGLSRLRVATRASQRSVVMTGRVHCRFMSPWWLREDSSATSSHRRIGLSSADPQDV